MSQETEAAEACGRDAWAHGVSIDGARAYSERNHIKHAWCNGWMEAENEQRKRRGELESRYYE